MNNYNISVPEPLIESLKNHLSNTEFDDVDEFAQFIIRNTICVLENESEFKTANNVDQDEVQERLESLGYLSD
ncbi:hypothetical protein [Haloferax sp. YSMS24]|uniref:hypothetical protein n=1 Tax=Haloferax sp. YSMS24 TaxID=3388425 RepID=UPI00398CC249